MVVVFSSETDTAFRSLQLQKLDLRYVPIHHRFTCVFCMAEYTNHCYNMFVSQLRTYISILFGFTLSITYLIQRAFVSCVFCLCLCPRSVCT